MGRTAQQLAESIAMYGDVLHSAPDLHTDEVEAVICRIELAVHDLGDAVWGGVS